MAWGATLTTHVVDTGEATQIDASGPAYDAARAAFAEAWDGTAPVDMGVGGSIPFIAEFLEAFPEASVLVTGVEDPDTRAHGANEGLHLAEFEKVVKAEALLLRNLGDWLARRLRSASVAWPDGRPSRARDQVLGRRCGSPRSEVWAALTDAEPDREDHALRHLDRRRRRPVAVADGHHPGARHLRGPAVHRGHGAASRRSGSTSTTTPRGPTR